MHYRTFQTIVIDVDHLTEAIWKLMVAHDALIVSQDGNVSDDPQPTQAATVSTPSTIPVSSIASSSLTANTKPSAIEMATTNAALAEHIKEHMAQKTCWYVVYVGREIVALNVLDCWQLLKGQHSLVLSLPFALCPSSFVQENYHVLSRNDFLLSYQHLVDVTPDQSWQLPTWYHSNLCTACHAYITHILCWGKGDLATTILALLKASCYSLVQDSPSFAKQTITYSHTTGYVHTIGGQEADEATHGSEQGGRKPTRQPVIISDEPMSKGDMEARQDSLLLYPIAQQPANPILFEWAAGVWYHVLSFMWTAGSIQAHAQFVIQGLYGVWFGVNMWVQGFLLLAVRVVVHSGLGDYHTPAPAGVWYCVLLFMWTAGSIWAHAQFVVQGLYGVWFGVKMQVQGVWVVVHLGLGDYHTPTPAGVWYHILSFMWMAGSIRACAWFVVWGLYGVWFSVEMWVQGVQAVVHSGLGDYHTPTGAGVWYHVLSFMWTAGSIQACAWFVIQGLYGVWFGVKMWVQGVWVVVCLGLGDVSHMI
ncbi:hypothetical protein BS47DRAFT_1369061 [Hydnum rufescens UP504]|uniref:Uncharacterized protein n=1 Tax=Hydnum rufescens UP504 TaxID=1448309 RepID=A0A9P6AE83_9AGAM|nr:hypothetical protein BS47DRAFT_1369061 [Hydnum rufescens UP504]